MKKLKKFNTGAPVFAVGADASALSTVGTRYEVDINGKHAMLDTLSVGLTAA